MFEDTEIPYLVSKVLQGTNCTIGVFGQANSGKTYTFKGNNYVNIESQRAPSSEVMFDKAHLDEQTGLCVRCIKSFYNQLYHTNPYQQKNYSFYISYFEVENSKSRKILDMLTVDRYNQQRFQDVDDYYLNPNEEQDISYQNIDCFEVNSLSESMDLFNLGVKN